MFSNVLREGSAAYASTIVVLVRWDSFRTG